VNDPIAQLAGWLDDAGGCESVEAVAMCLATADRSGNPSARIVLLRGIDERGLRFFTSYGSRKAQQLAENPRAAAVLYWRGLERQVRIEGRIEMLGEDESDAYFNARPRGHRIAAWASEQSEPLEAYDVLEARFAHFDERFEGAAVPRPHSWGGYLLRPSRIEFWHGRANRMHERTLYVHVDGSWQRSMLQP
jgi:pyridoxamine 5'-phosphate oxidase